MPDVTIINLDTMPPGTPSRQVKGDGCCLPFSDKSFDLAFSNSVIEHVPDHGAFAEEAIRVGRSYYVQTPNYWFPIEPHYMAPIIHFLPPAWRRKLGRKFTGWGLLGKLSQKEVDEFVASTHLLKLGEMQALFPNGTFETEKVLGMVKSLIVFGGDNLKT
jgi:SAM-dependent methyltransferase